MAKTIKDMAKKLDYTKILESLVKNRFGMEQIIVNDIINAANDQGYTFDGKHFVPIEETIDQKPEFKVGDWVVIDCVVLHIKEVTDKGYITDEGGLIPFKYNKEAHIWSIADAKDGDVLVFESGVGLGNWYCIFKSLDGKGSMAVHCYFSINGEFEINKKLHFYQFLPAVNPATKEQRDQLEKAMADAGYTFDFEKKKLKKIEQTPVGKYEEWYDFIRWFVKQRTDDYTLIPSNDDIHKWGDNILNHARKVLEQDTADWSEEDEKIKKVVLEALMADDAIKILVENAIYYEGAENWLKSLRPQNAWKPSEEQMAALSTINVTGYISWSRQGQELINLYQDLKKLKG